MPKLHGLGRSDFKNLFIIQQFCFLVLFIEIYLEKKTYSFVAILQVFFFIQSFSAFGWCAFRSFPTSCRSRSNGDDAAMGTKFLAQFHQKVAGVTFNVVSDSFLLFCGS